MEFIFSSDDIKISNKDTLIIGASTSLKKSVNQKIDEKYKRIDKSFSFSTSTVKETLENYGCNEIFGEIYSKSISDLLIDEYFYLAINMMICLKPSVLIIDDDS